MLLFCCYFHVATYKYSFQIVSVVNFETKTRLSSIESQPKKVVGVVVVVVVVAFVVIAKLSSSPVKFSPI